ncbi:unnamed protein product [Effrenium voratum]|nr:unnamed protein product [Effrenium voratum]
MGNQISVPRGCDDCAAPWDYKCNANVHFHCAMHYFDRLQLGTLPHGGPHYWQSRRGEMKLQPVPEFQQEASDSKVRMSADIPAPIRSAVLKSTSKQHIQDRLSQVGLSDTVDKARIDRAHDIIPKLRAAIASHNQESVNNLSNELMEAMPKQASVKKVKTEEELLQQIQILEMLDDILASQELDDYDALLQHCDVDSVDMDSAEAQLIHQYMRQNMRAGSEVFGAEVFRVARKDEQDNPRSNNQVLLWHGSKSASFVSILRNGLRLPKHATHGWAFGPGIYFADITSKSLQYCGDMSDCLLALAEVNLGAMHPTHTCIQGPPRGCDSVWAVGQYWPSPETFESGDSEHAVIPGCDIPMGRPSPVTFVTARPNISHNEFIVYDASRVRLRYLVRAKVVSSSLKQSDSELRCTRNIEDTETYYQYMKDMHVDKVIRWQYYLGNFQDGKAPGWHPYDDHLHQELEQRYVDGDEATKVMSGSHGYTYKVDFEGMKQTNLTHHNHTVRNIRRVEVDQSSLGTPADTPGCVM